VFSFAVMLYEMLTDQQAFAGQDVLELFQEIRNVQPDICAAEVPEPVLLSRGARRSIKSVGSRWGRGRKADNTLDFSVPDCLVDTQGSR
jgi:hypothetical protein